MTAPASVVGQVTAALRERCLNDNWIIDTGHDYVRAAAKVAADAAWAVAYPAALRDAADRLDGYSHQDGKSILGRAAARGTASTLRRWADESEAAK